MLRRALNALFLVGSLAVFCATAGLSALGALGIAPEWLQVGRQHSDLEVRDYATAPEVSAASLLDGSLQDGTEAWLADSLPRRDDAMMLSAAAQRLPISLAASALGYEAYPTFYGSDYVYWPGRGSALASAQTATPESEGSISRVAAALGALADGLDGASFYAYWVDRLQTSSMNPTAGLMPDPVDTEWLARNLYGELEGYRVIDAGVYGDYGTGDPSIYDDFFLTDHHWHGTTAYRAYADCVHAMLGEGEPLAEVLREYVVRPDFYGTASRLGRCDAAGPDHIRDFVVDLSGVRAYVHDGAEWSEVGPEGLVSTERYEAGGYDPDRYALRYEDYFHPNYPLLVIDNPGAAHPERTLLMIVDSYSNALERFFSANYGRVIAWDPRSDSVDPRELVEGSGADDVLLLCCETALDDDTVAQRLEAAAGL